MSGGPGRTGPDFAEPVAWRRRGRAERRSMSPMPTARVCSPAYPSLLCGPSSSHLTQMRAGRPVPSAHCAPALEHGARLLSCRMSRQGSPDPLSAPQSGCFRKSASSGSRSRRPGTPQSGGSMSEHHPRRCGVQPGAGRPSAKFVCRNAPARNRNKRRPDLGLRGSSRKSDNPRDPPGRDPPSGRLVELQAAPGGQSVKAVDESGLGRRRIRRRLPVRRRLRQAPACRAEKNQVGLDAGRGLT